jgi:hypothetical protein
VRLLVTRIRIIQKFMAKKSSNPGANYTNVTGDLSGQCNFLRFDKNGKVYWKDPYPKKKRVV